MTRVTQTPDALALKDAFAADVREYLQRTPRQLPSKYFYDELGSALFEAICRLPWYRITRAETSLLARHARDIVRPLQHPVTIAELGCGSGDKLATFAGAASESIPLIQLIDISDAALDMARYRLQAIGFRSVLAHHAMYEEGLARAVRERPRDSSMLVLFLGSNIGNFDPPVARELLTRIRALLREGDALLLGSDLVKPEPELLLAYDDPLLVTAAFNRNLLRRINDELGGTFDLAGFAHRAVWNRAERRVEAHLVSRRRQHARVAAAGLELTIDEGEWIWTESSHKYEREQILEEGRAAGFADAEQWIDADARFVLTRFSVCA
jgi:L-histidine Nalpha-methyltransferase